jgi:hypothetical protein
MKNLFIKLSIIAAVLFTLASCEKEYPYPSDGYPKSKPESYYLWENDSSKYITLWGKFLIIDAVMYVDNHETGQKTKYNHFDATKNISSMRWGGAMFDIETIIKDSTTYSFYKPLNLPGTGKFVLNGDTTKHYGVSIVGWNKAIVEDPVHGMSQQLIGGSSRPFSGQILNYDEKTVVMQIQEMEGSINGYNCRYWTQLTLRKIEEW